MRSDEKRKEKRLEADWQYSRQPTREGPGPVSLLSLSAGPLAAQAQWARLAMPTVSVKRDLLFQALGRTYSECRPHSLSIVALLGRWDRPRPHPHPHLRKGQRSCSPACFGLRRSRREGADSRSCGPGLINVASRDRFPCGRQPLHHPHMPGSPCM